MKHNYNSLIFLKKELEMNNMTFLSNESFWLSLIISQGGHSRSVHVKHFDNLLQHIGIHTIHNYLHSLQRSCFCHIVDRCLQKSTRGNMINVKTGDVPFNFP